LGRRSGGRGRARGAVRVVVSVFDGAAIDFFRLAVFDARDFEGQFVLGIGEARIGVFRLDLLGDFDRLRLGLPQAARTLTRSIDGRISMCFFMMNETSLEWG
jgi:hypothetical protein